MSRESRTWDKIRSKPFRVDITMRELDLLLTKLGFNKVRQSSSHRMYIHPEHEGSQLTIPCKNDTHEVKAAYIKNVYTLIMSFELILEK